MSQVFQLLSGPLLNELLTRPGNRLDQLVCSESDPSTMAAELYWATLSRAPSLSELSSVGSWMASQKDKCAALEDIE